MEIPETDENTKICLNADSSVPESCRELNSDTVRRHPIKKFPKSPDKILKWKAGSRQSPTFKPVTEYFVNEEPWQLWRAAKQPVILASDAHDVPKPIQGDLPFGTVVDLIVQNELNETIPMYKHGAPTWRLGSRPHDEFKYKDVAEAVKYGDALDVKDPPMDIVHDLPPLGWLALRWKVDLTGATMFHAVKLKYFVVSLAFISCYASFRRQTDCLLARNGGPAARRCRAFHG